MQEKTGETRQRFETEIETRKKIETEIETAPPLLLCLTSLSKLVSASNLCLCLSLPIPSLRAVLENHWKARKAHGYIPYANPLADRGPDLLHGRVNVHRPREHLDCRQIHHA